VNGVGRGMAVWNGGCDRRRGRDSFGVNFGRPIVTDGDFVAYIVVRERRALPKLVWEDLLLLDVTMQLP